MYMAACIVCGCIRGFDTALARLYNIIVMA